MALRLPTYYLRCCWCFLNARIPANALCVLLLVSVLKPLPALSVFKKKRVKTPACAQRMSLHGVCACSRSV